MYCVCTVVLLMRPLNHLPVYFLIGWLGDQAVVRSEKADSGDQILENTRRHALERKEGKFTTPLAAN